MTTPRNIPPSADDAPIGRKPFAELTHGHTPPVTWRALVDAMDPLERDELRRTVDSEIEYWARVAGYLTGRCNGFLSDATHDAAVRESNRLATKIRRALGYTFAEQNISF